MIDRYEFEVLTYIERRESVNYSIRTISDDLCISGTTTTKTITGLISKEYIELNNSKLRITEKGLVSLEPYCVKRAIILAAGFGSRMMPATEDRPKPMVTINGVRIIDTLLDSMVSVGINDITVIGGYQFEKILDLKEKYPFLKLVENKEYAVTNNISSAVLSPDTIHSGCYLCEADLFISNPQIITKYQYASNILGSYSMETDDWCFRMEDGYLTDYKKGNTFCYNYYGISYWTADDFEKLKKDFKEVYDGPNGKDYFWEFVPFVLRRNNYKVEIRPCKKQDIMEIDNYHELALLDSSYKTRGA